jgi:D-amino peptidase
LNDKTFMIRSDMEGLSGVVNYQQVDPKGCDYAMGLEMLRADLTACVEGLLAGGAARVAIYDEHFDGRNIHPSWLPANVSVICGKPPYRADWPGGIERACAGMIMLGFHAKAHTPNALLAHSYEHDICDLVLNGRSVGEIGIEAAVAGDWGVPLLMLTGDSQGVAEAQSLIPGLAGVSVKQSLGDTAAEVYALSHSTRLIREAAQRVARGEVQAEPFHVPGPVRLDVHLRDGDYLRAVRDLFARQMAQPGVLRVEAPTVTAAWADYWQLKLQAQRHVASRH